jgi:hypothetical protein
MAWHYSRVQVYYSLVGDVLFLDCGLSYSKPHWHMFRFLAATILKINVVDTEHI